MNIKEARVEIKKLERYIQLVENYEVNSMETAVITRNKETTLRSAVNNNAVRVADFIKVSEHMGYEIIVRERLHK